MAFSECCEATLPSAARTRSRACESSSPLRVRVVADRPRAGWGRGSGRASSQPPVVDAGHVLGPCPGREAIPLIEAGHPVTRVFFVHYEEHLILLTNGEFSVYLRVRWEVRLHLEPDLDFTAFHDHLVGAEGDVREGEAPSSRDVVLEAVPRAGDDRAVICPLEPSVVLFARDEVPRGDFPSHKGPVWCGQTFGRP